MTAPYIVKGCLFAGLLITAAVCDMRKREIPDIIPVLMIPLAFIGFNLNGSLFGLLVSGLPYLLAAAISKRKGAIGGGDIKLMAASGFVLGYNAAMLHNVLSLTMIVLGGLTYAIMKKKEIKEIEMPLAPFFGAGGILAYTALLLGA